MFIVDSLVEPMKASDPMISDILQDSENDLETENMTSMRHQPPQMDDFEHNIETWDSNENFNLFDYIGDEQQEQDQGSSLQDDPKDMLYKQWAYNQTAFGAPADYSTFQSTYTNTMGRAPPTATNQHNATVPSAYDPNNYYDYGSTSSASMVSTGSTPPKMNGSNIASFLPVKREPYYENEEMSYLDDEYSRPSAAPSATIPIDPHVVEERVNQVTKKPPRKYRMKSDNEKVNPVYKVKRAKNNDAVRRSREKAKVIQQQKEQRLIMLESDMRTLWDYHLKTLEYMKQNCRCGIALPRAPKLQTMER